MHLGEVSEFFVFYDAWLQFFFYNFLIFFCLFFCFSMKKEDTQEKEDENNLQENFVYI